MSMKLKSLVVLLGLSVGLSCILKSNVAYGAESTENKYQIMAGEWEIKTVGTKAGTGQTIEKLSQTMTLTFASEKQKKLQITGSIFGFTVGASKLNSAKKGSTVKFEMTFNQSGASSNSNSMGSGDFQVAGACFDSIGSGDIAGGQSNFSMGGGCGGGGGGAGGGNLGISWSGKLNEDGTKISNGKFSSVIGSGTFTAEKKGTEKAEKAEGKDKVEKQKE